MSHSGVCVCVFAFREGSHCCSCVNRTHLQRVTVNSLRALYPPPTIPLPVALMKNIDERTPCLVYLLGMCVAWDTAIAGDSRRGRTEETLMTQCVGTLLWSAPEVLRGDTHYHSPVDVYRCADVVLTGTSQPRLQTLFTTRSP